MDSTGEHKNGQSVKIDSKREKNWKKEMTWEKRKTCALKGWLNELWKEKGEKKTVLIVMND